MPKIGMEPLRRRALIDATVAAIGEHGSLDVTMSQIAGRAGVSSALAHHYFGAKDDLLRATMRSLLADLGRELRAALARAETPRERLSAIIAVNFSAPQFGEEVVAAWLAFYVEAQRSPEMRRLLAIYARRGPPRRGRHRGADRRPLHPSRPQKRRTRPRLGHRAGRGLRLAQSGEGGMKHRDRRAHRADMLESLR